MTVCTARCAREARSGQRLCAGHAADVRAWLAELPSQARLLELFVPPAAGPAAGRIGGTGRAHSPAPADLRVLVLLAPGHADTPTGDDTGDGTVPILAWLAAWADHIAYHYPAVGRDPYGTARTQPCEQAWPRHWPTIPGYTTWLTAYLPFTLTLDVAGRFHEQLGDLIHRIRDLTHATPHRHPRAAPCPECAAFGLVAVDGRWGITCEACGHHLEPREYDQHAASYLHLLQAKRANVSP